MLHKPLKLTEYVPAKAVDLTPDEAGSLRRLLPGPTTSSRGRRSAWSPSTREW